MHPVAAADDLMPGKCTAEDPEHQVRPDHRHGQQHAGDHGQAAAGEPVVGQDGAGVGRQQAQGQQRHPDQPVRQLPAGEPAGEPAAEEHPQQPQAYRRDEHVRRPVVHLPDQQPAGHVEADGQHGLVRLAHRGAVQQSVGAVIGEGAHRRAEERQQQDPGDHRYRERVPGDPPERSSPAILRVPPQRIRNEPPRRRSQPLHGRATAPRRVMPAGHHHQILLTG